MESDRVPFKGLVHLMCNVQRYGEDSDRLQTTLTCFNRLLVLEHNNRKKLKERLIVAIENFTLMEQVHGGKRAINQSAWSNIE